jgi:hypothetical protein
MAARAANSEHSLMEIFSSNLICGQMANRGRMENDCRTHFQIVMKKVSKD